MKSNNHCFNPFEKNVSNKREGSNKRGKWKYFSLFGHFSLYVYFMNWLVQIENRFSLGYSVEKKLLLPISYVFLMYTAVDPTPNTAKSFWLEIMMGKKGLILIHKCLILSRQERIFFRPYWGLVSVPDSSQLIKNPLKCPTHCAQWSK